MSKILPANFWPFHCTVKLPYVKKITCFTELDNFLTEFTLKMEVIKGQTCRDKLELSCLETSEV